MEEKHKPGQVQTGNIDQRKLDILIREREMSRNLQLREKRKKGGSNLKDLFQKIESVEEKVD